MNALTGPGTPDTSTTTATTPEAKDYFVSRDGGRYPPNGGADEGWGLGHLPLGKGQGMNALTGPGTPDTSTPTATTPEAKDYFVSRDGVRYAGSHLIIDLWDAHRLCDLEHVDRVLRQAAADTGATILHGHFHHFGEGCGVSGVLVLAESHVSIHTWPERGYAALDIFVCEIG